MKKKDIVELNLVFSQLKEFGATKFKYSILKNLELIKSHISALEELEKGIKEVLVPFENDRNNLILELGTQDDKGNTYIDQSNKETMELFDTRMQALIEVHKEVIDSYNQKIQDFQDILDEEIETPISFRKVTIEQCPESDITTYQLDKLIQFDIIND